ncbi:MAG: hypothetical protein K0R30_373 [Ornithinibacter sp.]|nr:hypothetical protein [Ornithinibacter sp.]
MGADPRRLDGLKHDERYAAVVVERATGARARAHDVDGRQAAYDIDLAFPDGRRAALEVTTHAGPGVRRTHALLRRDRHTWPNPGSWWWTIDLAEPSDIMRVRAAYGRAIQACESHGVTQPGALPRGVLSGDPELRWLAHESQSVLRGNPSFFEGNGRPVSGVLVTPKARTAWVDSRLAGLPGAVTELLAVPHVARRAAKVAAARSVDERHLFVGIGEGGLPDSLYVPLTGPLDAMPDEDPQVEEPLSHLWITTAWSGSPLLRWDRVGGWSAHDVGART